MKGISLVLLSLGLFFSLPGYAQYSISPTATAKPPSEDETATYLLNLGSYLGYDLAKITPLENLLPTTASLVNAGLPLLNVFFGASPINSAYLSFSDNSTYKVFNQQANILFPHFSSPSDAGATDVTAVVGFDQEADDDGAYAGEPVSQALLDVLGTPSNSSCTDPDDTHCLPQNTVMYTVLKDIAKDTFPANKDYASSVSNLKVLSQVHSDTLLGPLMYAATTGTKGDGLPTTTQQQQAMDFMRYAAGTVLPIDHMTLTDYDKLWNTANHIPATLTTDQVTAGQTNLMKYLLSLRVYAARLSAPLSNLSFMMQKRMPQSVPKTDGTGGSAITSEALNEFVMATWRIYSPGTSTDNQWVTQINAASAATTAKEIAILLAEMNYQMYLTRQVEERILFTNSMLMLQSVASNPPNINPTAVPTT